MSNIAQSRLLSMSTTLRDCDNTILIMKHAGLLNKRINKSSELNPLKKKRVNSDSNDE